MFDNIKSKLPAPVGWCVGWIVTALVLLFFWHPVWGFIKSIAEKADSLFK